MSIFQPVYLDDNNIFLKDFVGSNFLSVMGVLVTITLASAANLHIELRKMEAAAGKDFLSGTRGRVKLSAFSLIWLLGLSILAVFLKPILPQASISLALINGFCLLLLLFGVLVIADLTKLAFRVSPNDISND